MENAYRRALEAHEFSGEALPPLRDDPTALDAYRDAIRRWLLDFIENLLPPGEAPRLGRGFWETFLNALPYAGAALVFALAAWIVWKWLRRPAPARSAPDERAETAFQPPEAKLTKGIERALGDGRFAEAARLRWKLFLLRLAAQPTLTLSEYYDRLGHAGAEPDGGWPRFMKHGDELMFRDDRASLESFQWTDERLRALETPARERGAGASS